MGIISEEQMAYLICSRCASERKNCCRHYDVFVGLREAVKIHRVTGLPYSAFCEMRPVSDFMVQDLSDPGGPTIQTRENKVLVFKRNRDPITGQLDECVFLSTTGCQISVAKTIYCLTFPFWFDYVKYHATGEFEYVLLEYECGLKDYLANLARDQQLCVMGCDDQDLRGMMLSFDCLLEEFNRYGGALLDSTPETFDTVMETIEAEMELGFSGSRLPQGPEEFASITP